MGTASDLAVVLLDARRNTQRDQELVRNLCNSIRDNVIAAVPFMPDAWDGHELRKLLADVFASEVYGHVMRGSRLRKYRVERANNRRIP